MCREGRVHLFDFVGAEGVLEDLEVGDELVLVLRVHLDTGHWHVAYPSQYVAIPVTNPQIL